MRHNGDRQRPGTKLIDKAFRVLSRYAAANETPRERSRCWRANTARTKCIHSENILLSTMHLISIGATDSQLRSKEDATRVRVRARVERNDCDVFREKEGTRENIYTLFPRSRAHPHKYIEIIHMYKNDISLSKMGSFEDKISSGEFHMLMLVCCELLAARAR